MNKNVLSRISTAVTFVMFTITHLVAVILDLDIFNAFVFDRFRISLSKIITLPQSIWNKYLLFETLWNYELLILEVRRLAAVTVVVRKEFKSPAWMAELS